MELDWGSLIKRFRYEQMHHLVIFPFYKEPREVIEGTLQGLVEANYDRDKLIVVLAAEERAGEEAEQLALEMEKQFAGKFGHFIVTIHPDDVEGEIAGKGSNTHYALHQVKERVIDPANIDYQNILTSIFDIDTVIYPDYFNCLIWHFMTAENPYKSAFQPVPLFTNNLWEATAVARVMAMSSTFWQMIMQERPDKAATFSSHSVSFQALYEIGMGKPTW